MIRDIFDYILYRLYLFYDIVYRVIPFCIDLHFQFVVDASCILSFVFTFNIISIVKLFGVLTKTELLYLFLLIYFIILGFLIWYMKGERRYKALAHKYRNEKYHKLKGYAVLAYVILSFVLFFVVMLSK